MTWDLHETVLLRSNPSSSSSDAARDDSFDPFLRFDFWFPFLLLLLLPLFHLSLSVRMRRRKKLGILGGMTAANEIGKEIVENGMMAAAFK